MEQLPTNIAFDEAIEREDKDKPLLLLESDSSASDDESSDVNNSSDLESEEQSDEEPPGAEDIGLKLFSHGRKWSSPTLQGCRPYFQQETSQLNKPRNEKDQWHDSSENDGAAPPLPLFTPHRPPGFWGNLPIGRIVTPLDIFLMFFPMEMLGELSRRSVAFSRMRQEKGLVGRNFKLPNNFGPITMLQFIGFLLYTGFTRCPHISDYFTTGRLKHSFIQEGPLSRARVLRILGSLHFSTIEDDEETERKRLDGQKYDCLQKAHWLVEELKQASIRLFAPEQKLSLNRRLVTSKTKAIPFKQHARTDARKWGFELWVLACPRTGYTYNFDVNVGKKGGWEKKLPYSIVENLLKDHFLNCGHIVYMDGFCTSHKLFEYLADQGTRCVGTVKPSRQGYPKTLLNSLYPRSLHRSARRGDIRWYRKGKVVFIQWLRNHLMNVASTCHAGHDTHTLQRSIRAPGEIEKIRNIPIPTAILDYNKNKGGVNLSEQLIQCYEVSRMTKKWYKKIFFHCIDIAVTNSFIIYNELLKQKGKNAVRQDAFRKRLMEQLWDIRADSLPPSISDTWVEEHRLVRTESKKRCVQCSTWSKTLRTFYKCVECNVHLCFRFRNCSELYHKRLLS